MTNSSPVDKFTLAHAAGGAGLAAVGVSLPFAVLVAIGWELVERPLKKQYPSWFPHPSQDSTVNALLDAGAVIVGYLLVKRTRLPGYGERLVGGSQAKKMPQRPKHLKRTHPSRGGWRSFVDESEIEGWIPRAGSHLPNGPWMP